MNLRYRKWIGGVHLAVVAASIWIVADVATAQPAAKAEAADGFELTVANIMRGPDLVGTSPSQLRWSPDGQELYFEWKRPGEEKKGLYRVGRDGSGLRRLPEEEAERAEALSRADYSEDRRYTAYSDQGKLYLLDIRSGRELLLVSVPGRISSVQIAPDGRAVYFVQQDNLFRFEVGGGLTQLTDIRHGSEPPDEELDEQAEFLEQEQDSLLRVFDVDSIRRAHDWPPPPDTTQVDTPQAFYVGKDERIGGFWVAPDGSRMAFSLTDETQDARLAWVPDYVTEDGYTEQAPRKRTFVGDDQDSSKMGIMDLETGVVSWVDHGQGDRRVSVTYRGWTDDSRRLLAVGVSFDYHDRWVLAVDGTTGDSKTIDHLTDDAWIGGPEWNSAGWLPGGDRVWFISEASGYAHLYTAAVGGGEPNPLTTGPWEVVDVELSPDEREFYLVTSEPGPHERAFYRMDLDGKNRRRVTVAGTLHDADDGGSVAPSPDGRRLAALYSSSDHPAELYLQDLREGAGAKKITESTTEDFRSRDWMEPEIVYFTARDDVDVPARLYRPSRPNGAAVIFVHGAGYLQNVVRWWSSYYREYMFHNLLAERGYTVLDIDYRGSAGYGRDWRTAIRRHMGAVDLSDQVDGAQFLAQDLGIDPRRIGIYGGSYGGFITLMAMFTEPGVFAAGAALRPVTDWAYYNHWYTSRILGLPQDDAEAYRSSSPIYHAAGLSGALLIAHGVIDQNVHFQDSVRLVERLLELGKENWEIAMYPKEDHGFVHDWAWTDEYRRILELFEENLKE